MRKIKSKQASNTLVRPVTRKARARKEKRTYSLSADSTAFVNAVAKRAQLSASEALDQLIQQKKQEDERAQIEDQIKAYYDHLSPAEIEENRAWAKLGEVALASIGEEEQFRSEAPPVRPANRK